MTLNNLAVVYTAQKRFDLAQTFLERALAINEKAFGPDHPNVKRVSKSYANLLKKMGKTKEAETMEARANKIRSGAN